MQNMRFILHYRVLSAIILVDFKECLHTCFGKMQCPGLRAGVAPKLCGRTPARTKDPLDNMSDNVFGREAEACNSSFLFALTAKSAKSRKKAALFLIIYSPKRTAMKKRTSGFVWGHERVSKHQVNACK
jgi:hypothetical protein